MSEANKTTIRRWIDAMNSRKLDQLDALIHEDYVYHGPGVEMQGRQAIKDFIVAFIAGFPDIRFTIDDMVAEGDKVATRWSFTGTHRGDVMGIPGTGTRVTTKMLLITRFASGKVIEDWEQFDIGGLMKQLSAAAAKAPPANGADPTKVAPDKYKSVIENDRVRVVEARYGPKDRSAMHSHPDMVVCVIEPTKFRFALPDGSTQEIESPAGSATWVPAGNHAAENIGGRAFRALLIELK